MSRIGLKRGLELAKALLLAILGGGHFGSINAAEDTDNIAEIIVTGHYLPPVSTLSGVSNGVIDSDAIQHRVVFRSSEILESVPSLAVTLHSGESKANQYLLRGVNVDHGTDLAISLDGMPINEPTHAHGQGYAEVRNVIPELLDQLSYTKGTAQTAVGDFGAVGSLSLHTVNTLKPTLSWSVGEHQAERLFLAGTVSGDYGALLSAVEAQTANGPWTIPEQQRLLNIFEKWSAGDTLQGHAISLSFFHNASLNQTDQPQRALGVEIANAYAELDPSDQGKTQRLSVSGEWHRQAEQAALTASGYAFDNRLQLFNNYTHFLIDPLQGDQEEQFEHRQSIGGQLEWRLLPSTTANEWRFGLQTRHDHIELGRIPTQAAKPIDPSQSLGFASVDKVSLTSVAAYVDWLKAWSPTVNTQLGLREDWYWATDAGTQPGQPMDHLLEPKGTLKVALGSNVAWVSTAGIGFHSNDVRGAAAARLLAPQRGLDTGLIGRWPDRPIEWSVTTFYLHSASSTTYDPDVGQDSAGPASQRLGVESSLRLHGAIWQVDASFASARARFLANYDDGAGHVGEAIPNAPYAVGSLSGRWQLGPAWQAQLQWRYLGDFPLTSGPCHDAAVRADFTGLTQCSQAPTAQGPVSGHGYQVWNAMLAYALTPNTQVQLAAFNLLNSHAYAMEYYYIDRLQHEPDYGIADVHVHALDPFALRLTITTHW